jgi:hypothetical protein
MGVIPFRRLDLKNDLTGWSFLLYWSADFSESGRFLCTQRYIPDGDSSNVDFIVFAVLIGKQ